MANFYSNINLKQNQLQYPVIHPIAVPLGTEVPGQMYYDTDDDTMKFWGDPQDTGSYAWHSMANENTTYDGTAISGIRVDGSNKIHIDIHGTTNTGANVATTDLIVFSADSADAAPEKCTIAQLASAMGVGGDQELALTADDGGTATDTGGDLALTIAGATNGGIITAASSTTLTVAMDITDLSTATIASGDFLAFSDENVANDPTKSTTIDNFLGVVAGTVATTGLTQSGATLVVSDLHPVGVNGDANQLITDNGDGTVSSEPSFTYDGGILKISTGGTSVDLPQIILETTDTDPTDYPIINFKKNVITEDSEDIGLILWQGGDDNSATAQTYASIRGEVADASSGQEAGSLDFRVASFDGAVERGLFIDGDTNADGEVDVTIAAGAASTTTVAGNLSVTTMANAGSEQTAVVTDGTTLKTRELGTAAFLNASGFVTSFTAGDGLTEDGNDTTGALTVNIDSDQTGHIATIHTADLRLGEDSSTQIDFETANEIHFDVDGSELANFSSAAATFNVDTFTVTSSNANDPVLRINNSNADANPATLMFDKTSSSVLAGDDIGQLLFRGQNNGPTAFDYGSILVESPGITASTERGKMTLSVAAHQQVRPGIIMSGSGTADEVDVTIGNGAASVVTIPGNLTVTGTTTTLNETIQVVENNTIAFEGTTVDAYEVKLTAADAQSSDKTITLPDDTGTVALVDNILGGTNITASISGHNVTLNADLPNTMGNGFVVGVDTNSNATTIVEGETLTFTGGTGISTETTADGTVTFNAAQVALTKKAVIDVSSLTGALTTTITHNLNSQNLNVTLWEDVSNGDYEQVYGTVRTIEVNKITVDFDKAPSADVTVIMTRLSDITTIAAGGSIVYS